MRSDKGKAFNCSWLEDLRFMNASSLFQNISAFYIWVLDSGVAFGGKWPRFGSSAFGEACSGSGHEWQVLRGQRILACFCPTPSVPGRGAPHFRPDCARHRSQKSDWKFLRS